MLRIGVGKVHLGVGVRHGHARLSEPEDNGGGLSGSPRSAYDGPRLGFVACIGSVSWPDL